MVGDDGCVGMKPAATSTDGFIRGTRPELVSVLRATVWPSPPYGSVHTPLGSYLLAGCCGQFQPGMLPVFSSHRWTY